MNDYFREVEFSPGRKMQKHNYQTYSRCMYTISLLTYLSEVNIPKTPEWAAVHSSAATTKSFETDHLYHTGFQVSISRERSIKAAESACNWEGAG